ncbi:MAG: hypothetical protein MI924_04215 [Chloroflexales bacterium]|nr:hypothetical protein [Chloroflexales bacterium]
MRAAVLVRRARSSNNTRSGATSSGVRPARAMVVEATDTRYARPRVQPRRRRVIGGQASIDLLQVQLRRDRLLAAALALAGQPVQAQALAIHDQAVEVRAQETRAVLPRRAAEEELDCALVHPYRRAAPRSRHIGRAVDDIITGDIAKRCLINRGVLEMNNGGQARA